MRTSRILWALVVFALLALAGCGGGGSAAPALPPTGPGTGGGAADANVVALTVDGGTNGRAFNTAFVSVTVCVPGTSACQVVDHVMVDTGSYGLRLAASALDASVALPQVASAGGLALAECARFASGYAWGSVRLADVRLGGETASALPIEVVNDSAIAGPPGPCAAAGKNFGVGSGTNGILGIGVSAQDCGRACASGVNAGLYYACAATSCAATTVPLASQVTNPIAFFASDNNGAVVSLPPVPLAGVTSLAGTLTFGIGTRANNQLGKVTVYAADATGAVQTTYNGVRLRGFIDTGSNGLFFPDSSQPQCNGGFYCPASPQTLSAIIASSNGASSTVSFSFASVQALAGNIVAAPVGGTSADLGGAFDWGLPFFFGRTVFVAMAGASTPAGTGPYWAF